MSLKSSVAILAAIAGSALGHGTVSSFTTDGTSNQGFLLDYYYQKVNGGQLPDIAAWYAENLDNGFVEPNSYSTSDINCHKNSAPGTQVAKVAAGGTVDFHWTNWPHGLGPVLTYVAAFSGDAASIDKTTLKWVKIDEAGYDNGWAAQKLIDNNNTWTTTVPSTLKAGTYVFRHEIIALHGAGSENGAQNYPQCMNIEVTGSGTELPEGTLGTALYSSTDPGILFNPYVSDIQYTIPGPAVMAAASGSGSGGSATTKISTPVAVTTSSATQVASTAAPVTTAVATTSTTAPVATQPVECDGDDGEEEDDEPVATSTAAAPTTFITRTSSAATGANTGVGAASVALYGQCGGKIYTGSTTCASGTCKVQNDYYSQCVPN